MPELFGVGILVFLLIVLTAPILASPTGAGRKKKGKSKKRGKLRIGRRAGRSLRSASGGLLRLSSQGIFGIHPSRHSDLTHTRARASFSPGPVPRGLLADSIHNCCGFLSNKNCDSHFDIFLCIWKPATTKHNLESSVWARKINVHLPRSRKRAKPTQTRQRERRLSSLAGGPHCLSQNFVSTIQKKS